MPAVKILIELNKLRVTSAVAITTITGYAVARHGLDAGIIVPTAGLFLLACGSAVINHVQEKSTDIIMPRTRQRPLPMGKISTNKALWLATMEIIAGGILLYVSAGFMSLFLGIIALLWYNGIYTPLKKFSPNAVIPGSFIGAIPPLVGWTAAGGSIHDPGAWILALFFFIWQIPHFYLLAMKYGKEYENAGFPTLTSVYPKRVIKFMIYLWIFITSLMAFLFIPFNIIEGTTIIIILASAIIMLNLFFLQPYLSSRNEACKPGKYFMTLNIFVLIVIILLITDNLIIPK